jgi:very-short-patch-repair endonuclease
MEEQPSARHDRNAYRLARTLRRPLTPAEAVLWRELRGKRLGGFKFRRQQPVGPYVADFFCAAAGLVVELDGDSHVGREDHDARRTADLEAAGLRVVRFWNPEVYDNLDGVLTAIYDACAARASARDVVPDRPASASEEERGTGERGA